MAEIRPKRAPADGVYAWSVALPAALIPQQQRDAKGASFPSPDILISPSKVYLLM